MRSTFIALALIAGLAACSPQGTGASTPPAAEGFPRTVRSSAGEELVLPHKPRRVLPVTAGSVDLLAELVGFERVVALPEQALQWSSLSEDLELHASWFALPRFPKFTAEPVIALRPDLVLCDPFSAPETLGALQSVGIPVLRFDEVTSLATVYQNLEILGQALGEEQRAQQLAEQMRTRIAALRLQSEPLAAWRALCYTNLGSGGWVAAEGTTADAWIALAGMRNAALELGLKGHSPLDFEGLLSLDPDLIVLSGAWQGEGYFDAVKFLQAQAPLASLRALRAGHLLVMPPRLFSTNSHELVHAAEWLSAAARKLAESTDDSPSERAR